MTNIKSSWTDGTKRVALERGYKDKDFDLSFCTNGYQTNGVTLDEDMLRQAQIVLTRFVAMLDEQTG